MDITYVIVDEPRAFSGKGIRCLLCGMTSYHPYDIEEKYCANCKHFHKDPAQPCVETDYSSRMCERGTQTCRVKHDEPWWTQVNGDRIAIINWMRIKRNPRPGREDRTYHLVELILWLAFLVGFIVWIFAHARSRLVG